MLDDEIAKGSTVIELIQRLRERDARSIRIACTHGLFSGDAVQRLGDQPDVLEIVCTNTVPIAREQACAQAEGALHRPGPGRGDPAHPQRRIGQRPVPSGLRAAIARPATLAPGARISFDFAALTVRYSVDSDGREGCARSPRRC